VFPASACTLRTTRSEYTSPSPVIVISSACEQLLVGLLSPVPTSTQPPNISVDGYRVAVDPETVALTLTRSPGSR